jgi:hypothetical protein
MSKTGHADHAPVAGLKDITQYSAYLGFSPPRTTFSVPISIDMPAQMASVAEDYVQDTLLITLFAAFLYAGSSQVPLSTPRVLPTAAQLCFLPGKSGHAHPIYVCSRATLISLADCKNPTHSTWSPIAFLAGIEAAACSTCPPPAKHPHLGGGLSHGDPRRAPGAEFCALVHGTLAFVHACCA